MKGGELIFDILFKGSPLPLKDFIKNVGELSARSILAGFSLDKIYNGLKEITLQAIATSQSIGLFTNATSASGEQMQNWGKEVKKLGGSAKDMAEYMKQVVSSMVEARSSGGGMIQKARVALNVALSKHGQQVITNEDVTRVDHMAVLFEKIQKGLRLMPNDTSMFGRLKAFESLHLSESMAKFFMEGNLNALNPIMNKEALEAYSGQGKAWSEAGDQLEHLGQILMEDVNPPLTQFAKDMKSLGVLIEPVAKLIGWIVGNTITQTRTDLRNPGDSALAKLFRWTFFGDIDKNWNRGINKAIDTVTVNVYGAAIEGIEKTKTVIREELNHLLRSGQFKKAKTSV